MVDAGHVANDRKSDHPQSKLDPASGMPLSENRTGYFQAISSIFIFIFMKFS